MAENKGRGKGDGKGKGGKKDPDKRTVQDYGFVKAFLEDHPAVKRLVRTAVREQWTPDRLQNAVKETPWWRNFNDAQKKADLFASENPAEWQRQIDAKKVQLTQQTQQMGLSYTPAQIDSYARLALRNGYSDEEINSYLAGHGSFDVEDASGAASVTVDALREMASAYGLRMSDATLNKQVRAALGSGDTSTFLQGYADTLREQAKMMYPSIADRLDSGATLRDIASPYLEIAGSELGVDPNSFDLTDPKWTRMLTGGLNGAPMDQTQWMASLRSDQTYGWGKSNNAKQQAAEFGQRLAGLMRGGVGV